MASPYQKKMVRTSKIRSKVVFKKKRKMEESKTCQINFETKRKKNTNQTAKEDMVRKAKEAMEARQAPGSLQHTYPT